MELILASASPRRHELLDAAGVKHSVLPTDADETLPEKTEPQEAVMLLSRRKADAALASGKVPADAVVVAADTVVLANGEIFGKPKDEADARRMLSALSGGTHDVYTGITVTNRDKTYTEYEVTHVTVRRIKDSEIDRYIESGEPFGKAGAYAIQGRASKFITRIDGDYTNVVGLPVAHTCVLAADLGADI